MSPELFTIIILLFLSGFFSGSESALFSLRWWRLHFFSRSENRLDRLVARLMSRPRRLLITILLGNTIVNVFASSIAEHMLERSLPEQGLWIAIVLMTIILLVIGEITPKTIAITYPETLARAAAVPLLVTGGFLLPIRFLIEKITDFVTKKFERRVKDHSGKPGRDLLHMVRESEQAGVFSSSEGVVIEKILGMETITIDRVMVPRNAMVALPEAVTLDEAVRTFKEFNLRRLPMYRGSLDRITGILYAKDLLWEWSRKSHHRTPREIMRPPIFAPGCIGIKRLFDDMKKGTRHIAIVLDEYGGTAGLVTYDDILMIIFNQTPKSGEVTDTQIREISSDIYRVSPGVSLTHLEKVTGFEAADTSARTLNGFIMQHLDTIPSEGDSMNWISPGNSEADSEMVSWRIEIMVVSAQRIEEVRMVRTKGLVKP